ncbi:hypothetical protein K402DRAFT_272306 [Aulographum hederae CBS 113979]|uniref:Uncharacterized protein n=1 Tax=Aulographum hederae CBS 113979 TaxID=1176131 RepID=A0A6G1H8N5_9PEZI|nr:hypothetical protein K402DRAFT_272306 [Aulographum hederae CBS 113979]
MKCIWTERREDGDDELSYPSPSIKTRNSYPVSLMRYQVLSMPAPGHYLPRERSPGPEAHAKMSHSFMRLSMTPVEGVGTSREPSRGGRKVLLQWSRLGHVSKILIVACVSLLMWKFSLLVLLLLCCKE